MEVLLPAIPLNSSTLSECRGDIDFDDFFLAKLAYINCSSDIDVFQLQGNERISHLICAWDTGYVLCRRCDAESRSLPDFLQNFIVNLVHYSMGIWFSLEWEKCDFHLCCSLLVSMFRMRPRLMDIPSLAKLNWNLLMNIGVRPWQGTYFKEYMRTFATCENSSSSSAPTLAFSVETVEPPATINDIAHINEEGLVLTLLRLMKLFDAGCMESVKRFSICIISAWNQEQQKLPEHNSLSYDADVKRCLNMICHTHLMAVFERDSNVGFEIDNMINNIRFYYKCICDAQKGGKPFDTDVQQEHITPSRLFAITCFRLNQSVQDFIESVLPDFSRESCSTLFGAVSHAYATYLLASILVEMNKFNQGDFIANVDKYKETLRVYVVERERSERFILEEVHKQKLQCTSHNITSTVKDIMNFKTAIGKGNHSSNLVNHKPSDVQSQQERAELFEAENEKRYDPVFQTMPNNEIVTNEFYNVLSKTKYKGWHFAKLVLLLKIIERELNDIEKWCYHPGLTTQFMMSLEHRLAKRFEDLALIFQDHIFMEQEFWLTAFFLRPVRSNYDKVIYCGTRFFRTVNLLNKGDRDEVILKPTDKSADKSDEVSCAFMNAKYGLLSSTFDVKQTAQMTCVDTAESDYNSLAKALRTLRLPEGIIKDLLTVTFSPRHANFTWAAEWPILRKRCKMLLTNPAYKRELVESNMAEANDRLKYLKIDYDKYKNWPQLDYGTIEEGYENDYIGDDMDDSDDEDDYEEDVQKKKGRPPGQKAKDNKKATNESEHVEEFKVDLPQPQEILNELDNAGGLKRSSARRAAAVIASAMLKEDYNMKAMKKKDDTPQKSPNMVVGNKVENITIESEKPINSNASTDKELASTSKNLPNNLFDYLNTTNGFVKIVDIWAHEKQNKKKSELLGAEKSSPTTSSIIKKGLDVLKRFNTVVESDESSRSDAESFVSTHEAMNVSDTETSNSYGDISQDCWEELLPSFIVENNVRTKSLASNNVAVVSTEKETNNKDTVTMFNKQNENRNSLLPTNQCELKTSTNEPEHVDPSHVIIQSVEVFPAISIAMSYGFGREEKGAADAAITASFEAVAPADCTDAISASDSSVEVKAIKEHNKNEEEFVVSTTTCNETTDDKPQDDPKMIIDSTTCLRTEVHKSIDDFPSAERSKIENHEIIDEASSAERLKLEEHKPIHESTSVVCSKTEEHEPLDKVVSIETITEERTSHINRNESEKVEVDSSTPIESQPFKKQLTGKPKSFSEILAAQLLSEDSSSQSSSSTQTQSKLCRGSNSSEIAESETREKRRAELMQLCLRKKCFVTLERLHVKPPPIIREPIVRIKRLNLDEYMSERDKAIQQKRRSKSKPKNFYMEENCSPIPKTNKLRKRRNISPLNESDEEYHPKPAKESCRPSTRKAVVMKKTLPEKQQRSRAKSFSVVPRSASGLKVCISSLCDKRPPMDCIEISSSSESDVVEIATFPLEYTNVNGLIADEDDPLFEREADIELLC